MSEEPAVYLPINEKVIKKKMRKAHVEALAAAAKACDDIAGRGDGSAVGAKECARAIRDLVPE